MLTKKLLYSIALLSPLYLQPVNAENTSELPDTGPSEQTFITAITPDNPTQPATTAEIWNRLKVAIRVSQPGMPAQTIDPKKSFQSSTYPDSPISVQVPPDTTVKYITLTGQKGSCSVPACIYIQ